MDLPEDRSQSTPDPSAGRPDAAEPPVSAPATSPARPEDPLDEFFFRSDETGPAVPDFGPLVVAAAAPIEEDRKKFLGFLLGSEEYAVEIEYVREIVRPPPITEVPRAPAYILGVVTVRGEVIPILDPRKRLRLTPEPPGKSSRIVICDAGDGSMGVLVDAVSQVVRLPAGAIEPRPQAMSGAASEYLAGIGRERGRFFLLLDLRALLRSEPAGAAPRVPEAAR